MKLQGRKCKIKAASEERQHHHHVYYNWPERNSQKLSALECGQNGYRAASARVLIKSKHASESVSWDSTLKFEQAASFAWEARCCFHFAKAPFLHYMQHACLEIHAAHSGTLMRSYHWKIRVHGYSMHICVKIHKGNPGSMKALELNGKDCFLQGCGNIFNHLLMRFLNFIFRWISGLRLRAVF